MATPQPSPIHQVLQTPELLEQILSDLTIDRLLIVKRVSKFFYNDLVVVVPRDVIIRPSCKCKKDLIIFIRERDTFSKYV